MSKRRKYGSTSLVKYRGPSLRKLNRKVNQITRSIEQKHFDDTNVVEVASDAVARKMSNMAQGDTSAERQGVVITSKYIDIQGNLVWKTNVLQKTLARIIIFYDKSCNGILPNITDVLEVSSVDSQLNNVNLKRFQIISDRIYTNHSPSTTIALQTHVSIKRKLSKNLNYLGTSNSTAHQGKNSIFMLCVSDSSIFGALGPYFDYAMRMKYTDL